MNDPRESIHTAKRLGVRASENLDDWWVSWSPRNDNQNAEGDWSEWVQFAHDILAADAQWKEENA
jgi:hypothetical protein